jgi:hypothetical protein
MNTRTTWVLAIGTLLMAVVLAMDVWNGQPTTQRASQDGHVVDLRVEDVTGIEIVRTNEVISIARQDDLWRITNPLETRADTGAVMSMLNALEEARRHRTLPVSELRAADMAQFGLDRPALKVAVQGRRGAITVLVGGETATGDAFYLQVEGGDDVMVVAKALRDRLNRSVNELRDRDVLSIPANEVSRLEMKSDQRVVELAKSAINGGVTSLWRLSQPLSARTDQDRVLSWLRDLDALRVLRFVSENPADVVTYNLDEPKTAITLRTDSVDSGVTLLLGDPVATDASEVYAKIKNQPAIFTLAAADAAKLTPAVNELRDRHVLVVNESKIRSIELVHGADKVTLQKTGTDPVAWRLTAPVSMPAEDTVVNGVVRVLLTLEAREFVDDVATDLSKYGLMSPVGTATFLGEGTNVLAQLLVGDVREGTKERFVKSSGEPFVYAADSGVLRMMAIAPTVFRSRKVSDVTTAQVTRVTVVNHLGKTMVEKTADGGWRLVEPTQGVLDTDALRALIGAVTNLRADDVVRDTLDNLEMFGLDRPEMVVTLNVGDEAYELRVGGAPAAGGKYMSWNNPPMVFTVSVAKLIPLVGSFVTPARGPGKQQAGESGAQP